MPMRLGKLRKRLKKHGVRVESPTKGSHFKARRNTDEGVYVITAHNADNDAGRIRRCPRCWLPY